MFKSKAYRELEYSNSQLQNYCQALFDDHQRLLSKIELQNGQIKTTIMTLNNIHERLNSDDTEVVKSVNIKESHVAKYVAMTLELLPIKV